MSVRFYSFGGKLYPSVTSVLDVIAKPQLIRWAARVVAERAVEHAQVIATKAKSDPDVVIRRLADAPFERTRQAASTGTKMHAMAEAIAKGGRFSVDKDSMPFFKQLRDFVDQVKPEFVLSECLVVSDRYTYAGTVDAVLKINGRLVMADFKSSKHIVPQYALQLCAYRNADFFSRDGVEREPIPSVDGTVIIHVQPEGWKIVEQRVDDEMFQVFLAARKLFDWACESGILTTESRTRRLA